MRPPRPPKTLLFLVKKLKKDYKELILNPNAYTWQWLSQWVEYAQQNYYYDYHRKKLTTKIQLRQWQRDRNTKTCALLNKIVGNLDTFIEEELSNGFDIYPAQFAKKYFTRTGEEVSCSPKVFDQYISQDYIRLDTVVNEWAETDSFAAINTQVHVNGVNITKSISRSTAFNFKKPFFGLCVYCRAKWYLENLKESVILEASICPHCIDLPIINERPALGAMITEYHSHKGWKFLIQRLKDEDSLPMGIEIEVHPKTSNRRPEDAYAIKLAEQEFNKDWNNIYFERDGSLAEGGYEIISNPMTLEFGKEYWSKMIPIIKKYCSGWDVRKYNGDSDKNYGIHITMNRKYWKDYHIARLSLFLSKYDNRNFVWPIAQRMSNYNGQGIAGTRTPVLNDQTRSNYGHYIDKTTKKLKSQERNQSVNLKDERNHIEIRMFASTLNFDSFMKNFEFLDAFRSWCLESAYSIDYKDFLRWLGSRPHHKYRYEHLIAFLNRPKFFCKGTEPIWNEFKHLLKGQRGQLELFNDIPTEDELCA